jgi:hypothetical protein
MKYAVTTVALMLWATSASAQSSGPAGGYFGPTGGYGYSSPGSNCLAINIINKAECLRQSAARTAKPQTKRRPVSR